MVEKRVFFNKLNIHASLACKNTLFLPFENTPLELKSSTKLLIVSQSLSNVKFVLLNMLTIVLIGTGNVASHLFTALLNMEDVAIKQVFGRNQKALDKFSVHCQATSNPDDIVNADLYLIAVSDQAIASVSELIGAKKGIIAHTSGSVPLDAITHKRAAVLYPLQTFTTGKEIDFKEIPVCIESKNKKDMITLKGFSLF